MPAERGAVILTSNDAGELDRFLLSRAESSLVLLANARAAGLDYRGMTQQGTYAAYLTGAGINGVAAHYWNGMVILQAPEDADGLLRAVLTASGRTCTGIAGPYEQVQDVLPEILAMNPWPAMNGRDTLFSLDRDDLMVPGTLHQSDPACRHHLGADLADVIAMRIALMQEHLAGDTDTSRHAETRDLVRMQQDAGNLWVLESGRRLVATAAFSAAIPEMVQLGGVHAPRIPEPGVWPCRSCGIAPRSKNPGGPESDPVHRIGDAGRTDHVQGTGVPADRGIRARDPVKKGPGCQPEEI